MCKQAFNAAAQKDSRVQLLIGEETKREASTMKAIAVVTMTFLPATFVSVSVPVPTLPVTRLCVAHTTCCMDDLWNQFLLV
ncbi:hypothetical protein BU25DRAFT_413689 [Macroventuria anomochaeta]|uniref:Uncharacterized protein n=1 Tax=Macroventuria anomochaeta TaxID=301207 RepID=A0ACB6RS64_9PLEO|nr:uncharacterized protein BU25DRAFT_413689 [Macroventuria anomochaeta]KAF2624117.1 hypothetical protein BU25DRAFT_413689 [Macroventuria anomochaeta]